MGFSINPVYLFGVNAHLRVRFVVSQGFVHTMKGGIRQQPFQPVAHKR